MANDYSGRIWKITAPGTTSFGTANVKFKGGLWTGSTAAGQTFIITDVAGRAYTFTSNTVDDNIEFFELGWLSGPLTFSGTFAGEIDLFMATK
jgi:hypothetical protein